MAEILVNGEQLHEHDDRSVKPAPPNTVAKYVQVTSSAEFAIKFQVTKAFPFPAGNIVMDVCFDGNKVASDLVRPGSLFAEDGHVTTHRFCQSALWGQMQQNFQFSALSIVEGNEIIINEELRGLSTLLGIISAKFRYVENVRYACNRVLRFTTPDLGVLPEKALKGQTQSYQAGLGLPRVVTGERQYLHYDGVGDQHFATFSFKYCPLVSQLISLSRSLASLPLYTDALRALHILPSPVPLAERPEEELTHNELQELAKQLQRDVAGHTAKNEPIVEDASEVDEDVMIVESEG